MTDINQYPMNKELPNDFEYNCIDQGQIEGLYTESRMVKVLLRKFFGFSCIVCWLYLTGNDIYTSFHFLVAEAARAA